MSLTHCIRVLRTVKDQKYFPDEASEEHRESVPFGYVQTTLRLEGVTKAERLAITQHAILELPELEPMKNSFTSNKRNNRETDMYHTKCRLTHAKILP